jgi:YtkA-like
MRFLPRLQALALLAGAGACTTSSPGEGSGGSGTAQQSVCATDPRAEIYEVGLSATSADGSLKVSFMHADPAPPAKVNDNTWTVRITDRRGAPVTGATITVVPFMPDHGHGSAIVPQVTSMSAAGVYQVSSLDLFMPGIWTSTFTVMQTSGPLETVVFTFCVDG